MESGDTEMVAGMFKVSRFSGGGAMHPYTGEHFRSEIDPSYQFDVTFYPHGESGSERDNRIAGFNLSKPHVTVRELKRWSQPAEWIVLSITELRHDAASAVGYTVVRSIKHSIAGGGWHYDRTNFSECGAELIGVEHWQSGKLLQITCEKCLGE